MATVKKKVIINPLKQKRKVMESLLRLEKVLAQASVTFGDAGVKVFAQNLSNLRLKTADKDIFVKEVARVLTSISAIQAFLSKCSDGSYRKDKKFRAEKFSDSEDDFDDEDEEYEDDDDDGEDSDEEEY